MQNLQCKVNEDLGEITGNQFCLGSWRAAVDQNRQHSVNRLSMRSYVLLWYMDNSWKEREQIVETKEYEHIQGYCNRYEPL